MKGTTEPASNSPPKEKSSISTKDTAPAPTTNTNKPPTESSEKSKPVATSETKDTVTKAPAHSPKQVSLKSLNFFSLSAKMRSKCDRIQFENLRKKKKENHIVMLRFMKKTIP